MLEASRIAGRHLESEKWEPRGLEGAMPDVEGFYPEHRLDLKMFSSKESRGG